MYFVWTPPIQFAIAEYLEDAEHYLHLSEFFQQKRDLLVSGLNNSRFKVNIPQGTYFLNICYRGLSDLSEELYAKQLIEQHKIATIPLSAFYQGGYEQQYLRVCFAKKEETITQAIEILCSI